MKVIDLLNKMANGEEVPKVIKVHNRQYKWKDELNIYACGKSGALCFDFFVENNKLNDEIKIIKEDKKIEKLERFIPQRESDTYCTKYNEVADKINEIIDKLNKGDKE